MTAPVTGASSEAQKKSTVSSLALTCHNTPYTARYVPLCVCVCVSLQHTLESPCLETLSAKKHGGPSCGRERKATKNPEQIRNISSSRNEASWTFPFFHSLPLTSAACVREEIITATSPLLTRGIWPTLCVGMWPISVVK